MFETVNEEIRKHGDAAKILPSSRLQDIRQDIERLKSTENLNGFQKFILNDMYRLDPPDLGFAVRSVLIVASPTPALARLTFRRGGQRIPLLLPAGYISKDSVPYHVERYLNEFLSASSHHVKYAPGLPHKLLAARSGLGVYGRNNICHVEGMGSYVVLAAYYTDIPCGQDSWQEVKPMRMCNRCNACLNACPTHAIKAERFLIDNEICLTNLNEGGGEYAFPDWVPLSAHNCVYGCHLCQTACPANKAYSSNIVDAMEFNEEETAALLEGKPKEQFSNELMQKVVQLNMVNYLGVLPRNLKVLFDRES